MITRLHPCKYLQSTKKTLVQKTPAGNPFSHRNHSTRACLDLQVAPTGCAGEAREHLLGVEVSADQQQLLRPSLALRQQHRQQALHLSRVEGPVARPAAPRTQLCHTDWETRCFRTLLQSLQTCFSETFASTHVHMKSPISPLASCCV